MASQSTTRKSSTSVKSSSSSFASSSSSTFTSPSIHYLRNSTSSLRNTAVSPSSQSVRFGLERSISPSRSIAAVSRDQVLRKENSKGKSSTSSGKRMCMCSPTTHPGSFRCSLHKNCNVNQEAVPSSNRLNPWRSAMRNSLVRIGSVEGDWVKRALAAPIRPSSHQQRRRVAFQSRPSRLSVMSRAEDD